jgi:hypothetical protein
VEGVRLSQVREWPEVVDEAPAAAPAPARRILKPPLEEMMERKLTEAIAVHDEAMRAPRELPHNVQARIARADRDARMAELEKPVVTRHLMAKQGAKPGTILSQNRPRREVKIRRCKRFAVK